MPKARTAAKAAAPGPAPAPAEPPPAAEAAADFRTLRHGQIRPDPANPRTEFDPEALGELAASIAKDNLLEPLVVRPVAGEEGAFMLIAGERRWRAIGQAMVFGAWAPERPIPVMVRQVSEDDARRLALVENLQRQDLQPLEEARALKALAELTGKSAAQLGRDLGFSERWAQQRLSLLKLPEALQAQVADGALTVEKAREAVALIPQLPPVKVVELEKGRITVEEARTWLNAQPKAKDLPPATWLLMLEVFDKLQRDPLPPRFGGEPTMVECHADARFDEVIKGLASWPHYLFQNVSHIMDDSGETGRFQVGISHDTKRELRLKFGDQVVSKDADPAHRLAALQEQRRLCGLPGEPAGCYSTPWLNGPFEIPESLRAEIDAARAERAAREAEWAAQREAHAAERKAERAKREAGAAAVRTLVADFTEGGWSTEALERALADLGCPLPWKFVEDDQRGWGSMLVDATGEEVEFGDDSIVILIMCAVHNAAGLPPAFGKASDPDDDVDDDDVQIDLEDAIAAAGDAPAAGGEPAAACDDGLSPALLAVAGVRSPAPAPAP